MSHRKKDLAALCLMNIRRFESLAIVFAAFLVLL